MSWSRRSASPTGPSGSDSAQQQGQAAGIGAYTQLAPWESPPLGSVPLFLSAKTAIVGAAADVDSFIDGAELASSADNTLTRTLKASEQGVIKGFTMFIENPVTTTQVLWTLLINRVPVPGLNRVTILGRAAASVSRSVSLTVLVPPKARIDVLVLDVDGGAYNVGADIEGWTYGVAAK